MKPQDSITQRIERERVRFAIKDVLSIELGHGSLPVIQVQNAHASAALYLHGAHLTHYQPKGKGPVLWMSDWSWYEPGKPIRGGVPICWPWFGPNASDPSLPGHGFARLAEWTLVGTAQLPDGRTQVKLRLAPAEVADSPASGLLKSFPHRFELNYSVLVGPCLEMELTVSNTDDDAFTFEEALHTYFTVGDVREIRIHGLEGVNYIDKMQALKVCTQDDPDVVFVDETDRVYTNTKGLCELVDPKLERRIRIASENANDTVVWNPHKAKAKAMPDFGDKEWPSMVCLETANVGRNAIYLGPGESHAMKAVLSVQ